jgi:diguanylate cyclase (GGDEF)-like protein/PAS domain S-box-containing protein
MSVESLNVNKLLVREQAYQLFENAPGSAATQIIVAALFYTLFSYSLNNTLLILWCVTISFLAITRLILVWFYKKKEPENVESWLHTFTFITLLMGVSWACFSLFYLTIDNAGLKYLFFVVICGLVAGAVPILAAWTPAYYANTIPQLISLPVILLYSSSTVNYFLAISFIVYCLMLLKLQRNANDNIKLSFQLQHKNDSLVSELNIEIEQREQLINERTQALNNSLSEKTAIVNNKLVAIAIVHERKIQWANSAFETMLGYDKGEVVGCSMRQFYINDEDYQVIGAAYVNIAEDVIKEDLEFKCKDGKHIWVSMRGSIFHEEEEKSLWVFVDISERKKAAEKLRLLGRVFSSTQDAITITDANQIIIDVNPAFCEITGYSREEVIGQTSRILSSDRQSPEFYIQMWETIDEQGHWQGEIWNRKKSGEVYAELLTISELKDHNGNRTNLVGIFSDITRSKQQQEELKLLAHYDVLTKLPNRILFTDRFQQAVAHSKRSGSILAVCFLDLDDFKPVNDNFGHDVGDKLLIEVAHRITACIRQEDTVARLGGDEFSLLLGDTLSYEQCQKTMERVHYSLAKPYWINGVSHQVTASSGITLYPMDEGDVDVDTLLRHADQAMYLAKQAGRNRYQLFNLEQEQKTTHKNHRLAEIESALAEKGFCLYYQPKVNMVTGNVFGVEALIRWNHPKQGLIPPLDFLPIIDGTDLDIQIGEWVTNEALAQLELWQNQGIQLEVSINISARHLLSDTFVAHLEEAFAKYPSVKPQSLQLEILENSVLADVNAITQIINVCQSTIGVSFALDDFGTGYSSLTHLRNLPAGSVKIDQSFIRDMIDDPSDYAIVDGVVGLANSFSRNVIAEGVETTAHGLMLLLIGCEQAQGYGIAKPMPANELPDWLSNYKPNAEWQLCGSMQRSKKESEKKLFRLTTDQWKNKFVENIISGPETAENWPIMDDKLCPCGSWLKRAKRAQIFDREGLNRIEQTHENVHKIANNLFIKYQEGEVDEARKGLKALQEAFDEMTTTLRLCN